MEAPIQDKRPGSVTERVLRRLPATFADDCWEWPGKRNDAGYGVIRRGGRTEGDARVTNIVYEHFHGPMTERLIMHTCDNPPCVNPKHLIQGSDADNMRDKTLKGRAGTKLSVADVQSIRFRKSTGSGTAELSRDYGVSLTTIKNIVARRTWKHL